MAGHILPNIGTVTGGWSTGDNGWAEGANGNWDTIDDLVQSTVISTTVTAPPGSPQDGERYIVPAGATGAWAGQTGKIARWHSDQLAWIFYTPDTGWQTYAVAQASIYRFSGSAWVAIDDGNGILARLANTSDVAEGDALIGTKLVTGAAFGMTLHARLEATAAHLFDFIDNATIPHAAILDGTNTIDLAPSIQNAFNWARDNGGTLNFPGGVTLKCQSALTLLIDSIAKSRKGRVLNFNGCVFDFQASGITTATPLIKFGATALANVQEQGQTLVGPFVVIGTADQANYLTVPATSVIGLQLEYALKWEFLHVGAIYCYTGWEKKGYVWDDVWHNVYARNSYIGWIIRENCTHGVFVHATSINCAHAGVVVADPASSSGVTGQLFESIRAEGCTTGFTVDPGDTSPNPPDVTVQGLAFKNTYFEQVTYDLFRFGLQWQSDPSVRGGNRNCTALQILIEGSKWNIQYTSTKKPIVFSTNGNIIGIRMAIPARFSDLVGRPRHFVFEPQQYKYDLTAGVLNSQGWEVVSSDRGWVKFHWDGAAVVVDAKGGNVETVTRTGLGEYVISFYEYYFSSKDYRTVTASCNAGFVFEDYADGNNSRAAVVVQCVQHDGTNFDPTIVSVNVTGLVSQN